MIQYNGPTKRVMASLDIQPDHWIMPNRVRFPEWLYSTFKDVTKKKDTKDMKDMKDTKDDMQLFEHQKFIKNFIQYDSPYRGILLYHGLGVGKCHAKDTPILMFNGDIKMVQDIQIGDVLMGDDSSPRNVLSLTRGNDTMYNVTSDTGHVYSVNSEHILCLMSKIYRNLNHVSYVCFDDIDCIDSKSASRITKPKLILKTITLDNETDAVDYVKCIEYKLTINISIKDYIDVPYDIRSRLLGYRRPVNFKSRSIPDKYVDIYNTGASDHNAPIPRIYMINDRETRLKYLAGVLDGAALMNMCKVIDGRYFCITYMDTHIQSSNDLMFLSRSLGFASEITSTLYSTDSVHKVHHVSIFATNHYPLNLIPCKCMSIKTPCLSVCLIEETIDKLYYDITVTKSSVQDYYGFMVDNNHQYFMGDLTVTHNSCSAIVAAEALSKSMDIVVLLPASLSDNFINEIKKCGNQLFIQQQKWDFIPDTDGSAIKKAIEVVGLPMSIVKQHNGLWISGKGTLYSDLLDAEKVRVTKFINDVIHMRYTFLHYNGLTRKNLANMSPDYFKNKIVIIDEVHNFVSTAMKPKTLANTLYQKLLGSGGGQNNSGGTKLIMLSGTPIINKPSEIAYTANLAKGLVTVYVLRYAKMGQVTMDALDAFLRDHKFIDTFKINTENSTITFTLLNEGYEFKEPKRESVNGVMRSARTTKISSVIETILKNLDSINVTIKEHYKKLVSETHSTLFPLDEDAFNESYVTPTYDIQNKNMFSRRIMGLVSHYEKYDTSLYPSKSETNVVTSQMSDEQFEVYFNARSKEFEQEERARKLNKKGNVENPMSSGNVFKSFSRAACSFAFPKSIPRPYPNDIRNMKAELDVAHDEEGDVGDSEDKSDNKEQDMKNKNVVDYDTQVLKAMAKLESRKQEFLSLDSLKKYSPKYFKIFRNIKQSPGSTLVYSQFRAVEGLGVFSLMLEANGYSEFKIKRGADNGWELNIEPEDYAKPKYIKFASKSEKTQVLMNIFNSDFEKLPQKLVDQMLEMQSTTNDKKQSDRNKKGQLIKVIMITQSGAEGISLKNVRQVHIMEPYWNDIRIQQVIGRAIRTRSHMDLPEDQRHVDVFVYITKLSKQQKETFLLKTKDNGLSSDERVYNLAQSKKHLISQFLDCMKESAVDCNIYGASTVSCYNYDYRLSPDKLAYEPLYGKELNDERYLHDLQRIAVPTDVKIAQKIQTPDGKVFGLLYETDVLVDIDVFEKLKRVKVIGFVKRNENGNIHQVVVSKLA